MTKVDLRERPVTVDELLQLASTDNVVIVNQDGNEFVIEAADALDREAAQLGAMPSSWRFSRSGPENRAACRSMTLSEE